MFVVSIQTLKTVRKTKFYKYFVNHKKPIFQVGFFLHLGVHIIKPKDKTRWEWETIEVPIEESFSEYFGFQKSPVTHTEILQRKKKSKQ